jgi:hypothetical protein
MSDYDYSKTGRNIDTTLSVVLVLGMMAIIAMALAACASDKDRTRSIDLAVKGSYIPGKTSSTGNQIPQGGTDEKSSSAPTVSME